MTELLGAREVPCPHCKGTGALMIPPEVATVEAYYFGCRGESGHYLFAAQGKPWMSSHEMQTRLGSSIYPKIDGGFCPGAAVGKRHATRPEIEGEAALHCEGAWTILSFWDRSIDRRPGSLSAFVALGKYDYATMRAIAEAQFPKVWDRYKFEIKLVEES